MTTLPANWERICGARFRRPTDDAADAQYARMLQLTHCINADEWLGIPPGRLSFGTVNWYGGPDYRYLEWYPRIHERLQYVNADGGVSTVGTVPLKPHARPKPRRATTL